MGAGSSGMQEVFSQVLSEEPGSTLLTEEIHKLSYEEFIKLLGELNLQSKKYLDAGGNQLVFAVKKDTDTSIFWKATVQIACVKIEPESQKVLSHRFISLIEFLKVFKTLKCQISAAEHTESASEIPKVDLSDEDLYKILKDVSENSENNIETTECCICFERKQEVTLPCAHSYCLTCIQEWNEIHDTCPICRERLESTDDTWVISEVPKADEISKEIRDNLMELTVDKPSPCTQS